MDVETLYRRIIDAQIINQMRPTSLFLGHIREITYEFDQRIYVIKPSPDAISITIEDLPLQTRFISNVPKTIFSQELLQRPVQIFECLVNQYVANYKLPKNMLVIEKSPAPTLLINLSYPGAPVRELRYDCSSQEILNPKLQSYQVTLTKMADKAIKEAIERYMLVVKQTFQQYSDSLKKSAYKIIEKIEKKGAEIYHLNQEKIEKIIDQAKMEISKGIKDYKEHLEGQNVDLRREIDQRASIMMKQAMSKMNGLQLSLLSCRQNQQQIYQKWQDIEFNIMQQIDSIKDKLTQKLDLSSVQSLLQKFKNQKPPQPQPSQLKSTIITNLPNEKNVGLEDLEETKSDTSFYLESTNSTLAKYNAQKTKLFECET